LSFRAIFIGVILSNDYLTCPTLTPNWVADAGVNYTLRSIDAKLTSVGGKFYDLGTGIAYNPGNASFKGTEYTLTAIDGTQYLLDSTQGLVGQIATNGTKLIYTDSGIIATPAPTLGTPQPTAEVVAFIKDTAGRIAQITAPDSSQLVYEYNSQGDLVSVSNSGTGKIEKYGYNDRHQLQVLTSNIGSPGEVIASMGTTTPIVQNLGGLNDWNNGKSLAPATQIGDRSYTFELRDSELKSTPKNTLLISIEGSDLSQINGIDPVYTNGNYRIFTVDRSGINLLQLTTPTLSVVGSELRVIGDVNSDSKVDGVDAALVTNAFGTRTGDTRYDRTFDLDRNGAIDAADLQLLSGNYGFTAAAGSNSTRPGKLGTVRQTPTAITLTEGSDLLTQTTQRIKLVGTGQHLVEFDVEASFNLTDTTSAAADRFAVYLIDPITRQTILDRGERGSSLFSITDTQAEIAKGLVTYQGSRVRVDVGSLNTYGDAELVFQLINADRDTGSTVTIKNLSETIDADVSAAILRPDTPQLATLGGAIDLTSYTPTTTAKLLVSNLSVDSTTGKYVADLQVQNTGTTNLARNLAVLFPNLPAGVDLVNKSGTDVSGVPYLNFQQAIEFGGLLPTQTSASVRVTFDDLALTQFSLTPTFLVGSQDVAPTFKSLGTITVKPGERFTTDLIATDPNNVPIGIGLENIVSGNADGLSAQIDSLGQLTIAPSPTQIGTHTFTLTARQGNLFVTQDVTVNVVSDPITTTRVSGKILGTDGTVLAGAVITLGNAIATTNALGEFTLTVPATETASVLKVTERIAPTGIGHSGFSTDLNTLLGHSLYAGSNNQLVDAILVPLIDFSRAVSVDSTDRFVVTNSLLPQVALTIPSGSLVDAGGQPTTALVSLSEVPLSALPAAFPDSFYPDTVISVTFSGEAKLTTAAAITAPNRAEYAPDTKLNLWKLDTNTGEFKQVVDTPPH
jgi:YD repeat-containing protein